LYENISLVICNAKGKIMATYVNTTRAYPEEERVERVHTYETDGRRGSGIGFVVGTILAVLLGLLLLSYILPTLRGRGSSINIPRSVDVNVNPSSGGSTPAQ
jgi:hypothetical protein